MMATEKSVASAPSASLSWESIHWKAVKTHVRRLQMRIAKAVREGHHHKAKALQWLLTHSYNAKLLAIRRVTQNPGKNTPGVDGIVWKTSRQKMQAASEIKRRGYQPKPLRRIYILKKDGHSKRPLSIPAMIDRCQQAIHLMALEPVVETIADRHSYGFRPDRSCADAIEQCFIALARRNSAMYALEGDIKSCFDTISHPWLLENTLMDKIMLKKWLAAGYVEERTLYRTEGGVPQGGLISACLLVNVLTGLETTVKAVVHPRDKVNVCIYADDFIITGISREILENKVKPVVQSFLAERGLSLSEKKTKITHIGEGFDFLGFNIRKYNNGKLLIKPSKASVKRFLNNLRELIRNSVGMATSELIRMLNLKIRGWCNYYRHAVSKKTFSKIDHSIFKALTHWAKRRHPEKNVHWRKDKYFRQEGNRNWVFYAKALTKKGIEILDLFSASSVPIERHVKIRCEATPYDPAFKEYFAKRHAKRLAKVRKLGLLGQLDKDGLRMARAV